MNKDQEIDIKDKDHFYINLNNSIVKIKKPDWYKMLILD